MKVDATRNQVILLHPRHAVLVTCRGRDGRDNIIAVSWCTPLSRKPPLVGISIAPKRFSHGLIRESGEFIVNIPTMEILERLHYCGTHSGRDVDKFEACGFTKLPGRRVKASAIAECIAHLECKVVKSVEAGDHTFFIGEVVEAYADEGVFDGAYLKPEDIRFVFHLGGNAYTTNISEVRRV